MAFGIQPYVWHTDLVGIRRCSTYRSGRCVCCGMHAALERNACLCPAVLQSLGAEAFEVRFT